MEKAELFTASYYFVASTITTVGYGDISATTTQERIIAIFIMITGVISFSYATGTLSAILSNYDNAQKIFKEQMAIINNLDKKFALGQKLYLELKRTAAFQSQVQVEDYTDFLDSLAPSLKMQVSLQIHKQTKKNINFFRDKKDKHFIVWICPLLKPMLLIENMYIYKEEDEMINIYFLEKGHAAYVLPRFENFRYIDIEAGDTFGTLDLLFRHLQQGNANDEDSDRPAASRDLKFKFTTYTIEKSVLLTFEVENLHRMSIEYPEFYQEFF